MLYYIFYQLIFKQYGAATDSFFFKGLNVFQYVTFRTAWATITALLISLLFGGKVIEKLASLKIGQEIREELSLEHQAKKGTPTMGGVLILGSVFISTILWARLDSLYLWLALGATSAFGIIGFLDDYIKIVKKRSLGLTGKQKLLGQLITALIVWGCLYWFANYPWNLSIPFFKETAISNVTVVGADYLFVLYHFRSARFVKRGESDRRNGRFGDERDVYCDGGVDGSDVCFERCALVGNLAITHKPEAAELTVFCGAMVGASFGFLVV